MELEDALNQLRQASGLRGHWKEEAKKAYQFVAGDQWAPEDRQVMEDKLRPVVTFNRIAPIVDAIVGHEVTNRQTVSYIPRTLSEAGVNEVLDAAAQWVRDECDAEGEEGDAFRDCVICGEGWTETAVSYDDDLDGRITIARVDPMEMTVDPASTKKNYADARWICRSRILPRAVAQEMWPDGEFASVNREEGATNPVDVISAAFYHEDSGAGGREYNQDTVQLHDFQWFELEPVYRVPVSQLPPDKLQMLQAAFADQPDPLVPSESGLLTFTEEQWAVVKDVLGPVQALKQKRKAFWRMYFSGDFLLEKKRTPTGTDYTYKALTAKRDYYKRFWYGIVRGMMDPQLWSNKFMSSMLEIIATSGKGGVIAEVDAFENPRQAENDWADPARIIYATSGAIAAEKIMPRPVSQAPQNMQALMAYSNQSLNEVAGVNPAVMGFSQALDTSGVLEERRQSAGLALLSYLFDALRRYRKEQGLLLMHMIRRYIPQGRLIRLVDQQGARYVPLVYRKDVERYDVIVDEAPSAPNVKERTWNTFIALAPHMPPAFLTPQTLMPLLDYSPFPQALVAQWKQAANPPPQVAAQQQQMQQAAAQLEMEQKKADIAATQADAAYKHAQAQNLAQTGQVTLVADQARSQAEVEKAKAAVAKAQAELQAAIVKAGLSTQAEAHKASAASARASADIASSQADTLKTLLPPT